MTWLTSIMISDLDAYIIQNPLYRNHTCIWRVTLQVQTDNKVYTVIVEHFYIYRNL